MDQVEVWRRAGESTLLTRYDIAAQTLVFSLDVYTFFSSTTR